MYALLRYVLIAYGYTWSFHLVMYLGGIPWASPAGQWLYGAGLFGPLVAAITLSMAEGGPREAWRLLGRARPRGHLGWYLLALCAVSMLYLTGIGLFVLVGGEAPHPLFQTTSAGLGLILLGQVAVVVAEEFGWRGYALPRLQALLGSRAASVTLGLVWASWHLPMFLVPGSAQYRTNFLWFSCILIVWSLVMTYLWNRTGSTLTALLFHMGINGAFFFVQIPDGAATAIGLLLAAVASAMFILLPRTTVPTGA